MKYLVILLIVVVSCSKSETKPKCYDCLVQYSGSTTNNVMVEKCTNKIDTMHFEDGGGNSLMFTCSEK